MHEAAGCSELDEASEGETLMYGYAADGYAIDSPLDDAEVAVLDECNGHTVIECFVGQTVAGADGEGGLTGLPRGGE